jgi:ribose 5-phosphate isomerase RpiB
MSIVAGKFPGVYPALVLDEESAAKTRKHNNTNFLTLAGDKIGLAQAKKILAKWLETSFYQSPEEEAYLTRFIKTLGIEKK